MSIEENRKWVSEILSGMQDENIDPKWNQLWIDYHDIVMSLPDIFFSIRPKIHDCDYYISWSGFFKWGKPLLPGIDYRLSHKKNEKPTIEVQLRMMSAENGGEVIHTMNNSGLVDGKFNDAIYLSFLEQKMAKWVFEQL